MLGLDFRSIWLAAAVGACAALIEACSGGGGSDPSASAGDGGLEDGGGPDAFHPIVEASDPCQVAGYRFDGESDCDVVRCPDLTCECPSTEPREPGEPEPPAVEVTLSGCLPGKGCLDVVDCERLCNPATKLTRDVCEQRLSAVGSQSCTSKDDCVRGDCREESVGSICIDMLQCAEDGHCGAGSACLFNPSTLDPETSFPTSLGACADGLGGSTCYEDGDCRYGRCSGQTCVGGEEGDTCQFDSNCASGFCRIYSSSGSTEPSGNCVSGEQGGSCADDGDCASGLHCTGGVCYSDAVGQGCETDDQCASGVCVYGLCRGKDPGAWCEEDSDCSEGFCVGSRCASGGLLAPCYEPNDCETGFVCARQVCTDGSDGMPCSTSDDCTVHACVRGECSDGSLGSVCESASDCASNRCPNPAGVEPGQCTDGRAGARCITGNDCTSGRCSTGGVCN